VLQKHSNDTGKDREVNDMRLACDAAVSDRARRFPTRAGSGRRRPDGPFQSVLWSQEPVPGRLADLVYDRTSDSTSRGEPSASPRPPPYGRFAGPQRKRPTRSDIPFHVNRSDVAGTKRVRGLRPAS